MTGAGQRAAGWPVVLIVLVTTVLAWILVRWADREYRRVERPVRVERRHSVPRPDWIWALEYPYGRCQHDWVWICAAFTLGVGAILATDGRTWSRRGLSRPGTMVVLVVLVVGGVTIAQQSLALPVSARPNGLSYSLGNALEYRLPGAIVGVWVVAWLRPRRRCTDWRERAAGFVGWSWMATVGLLIGYGLLFG